ncbi:MULTISPECIES: malto-oligosyltrehalose trehalohydrolase [Derxia]|uniref:Malto-oligosyltrehalose trehalohydrolase n=1 Tax=Derxia gummosa DSM 723 TaxID=1121388 RepID=A0A8B6XB39_9BURK|nr:MULTISPECIES: malto-oligosyltrehalose trehalohydrolase [Derxia]
MTPHRPPAPGAGDPPPGPAPSPADAASPAPEPPTPAEARVIAEIERAVEPAWGARTDGGATGFRLWAPACTRVDLCIDGRPPEPMTRDERGVFSVTVTGGAGMRYRFRLGDGLQPGLLVPDPASRAQAGDVHDASLVVAPDFDWRHPDWPGRPWHEAVIYEVHAGLCGGFAGVADRLPELAALGFTCIELMPVADFAGPWNWGYDGVLPFAPDAAYGSPADLKALIDAAHGLGLMVMLDVVCNHFGPDGNYLGAYAPDFFRDDLQTPWGGAIDFRRPEVRGFFSACVLQWLVEYRVDGIRFDAVHAIPEADWLDEMAAAAREAVEVATPGRQVHLVIENERNEAAPLERDFDAQWCDDLHHAIHCILTGEREGYYEDFADRPAEHLARGLAEGFIYQGEPSAHAGGAPRGTPGGHLPTTAFVFALQNHDQIGNRAFGDRLVTLCEPAALRAAIGLQLLAPFIPLVFMGEEMGTRTPFLFFTSFAAPELATAVREGRRREFARFAAFADPARRERIPDPNAKSTFEASVPEAPDDADDWRAFYRELLALRAAEIAPRIPGARSAGAEVLSPDATVARWRLGDGRLLTIACNLGAEPLAVAIPAGGLLWRGGARAEASADLAFDGLPGHTTLVWLDGDATAARVTLGAEADLAEAAATDPVNADATGQGGAGGALAARAADDGTAPAAP